MTSTPITQEENIRLYEACRNNDGNAIREIFAGREELIHSPRAQEATLLNLAARKPDVMRALLDVGADPQKDLKLLMYRIIVTPSAPGPSRFGEVPPAPPDDTLMGLAVFDMVAEWLKEKGDRQKIAEVWPAVLGLGIAEFVRPTAMSEPLDDNAPRKRWVSRIVETGFPQYDMLNEATFEAMLSVLWKHDNHIRSLASRGVDLSPVALRDPAELSDIVDRKFKDAFPRSNTGTWKITMNTSVARARDDAMRFINAWFAHGDPTFEMLMKSDGTPLPDTRLVISLGLSGELFSPTRWKSVRKALETVDALSRSLPEGWDGTIRRDLDVVAMQREAVGGNVDISSVAARLSRRRVSREAE